MKILGIDPSLNATGYAVIKVENSKLNYIISGVIKHEKETDLPNKLLNISNVISSLITKHNPSKAGIEETFVNSNFKTSLKLGMVRGVILSTLAKYNLPILEIAPNLVKKNVVGNGKADKAQVAFMIHRLLNNVPQDRIFSTDDETDALAVAVASYTLK